MKKFKIVGIGDVEIIFNTISAEDAERYFSFLGSGDCLAEEYVFNEITDNAYDLNDIPAGLILSVIYSTFKLSGVVKSEDEIPDKIEKARSILDCSFYMIMYMNICKYMPYKLESLKKKTAQELFELFVMAEAISGSKIIDTKKMRESITEQRGGDINTGIKGTTKQEIELLQGQLDKLDFDSGML